VRSAQVSITKLRKIFWASPVTVVELTISLLAPVGRTAPDLRVVGALCRQVLRSFEDIVGAPPHCQLHLGQCSGSRKTSGKLERAPCEHRDGVRTRLTVLYVISGVEVPS